MVPSAVGKQYGSSSETKYDSSLPLQKVWKEGVKQIFVHPYSQEHYTGQTVQATQVSMDRWTDKQNVIYTQRYIMQP